jgi:hypothetical protein
MVRGSIDSLIGLVTQGFEPSARGAKNRPQAPSALHDVLEGNRLSRVDAQMICKAVEEGKSVSDVYAT